MCTAGLEGIIAKKADAPYLPNKRTENWLKIKSVKHQEFVIGGYTPPNGSRTHFGALLLGVHQGKKLLYSGKVGTGFNKKTLEEVMGKMKSLKRKTSPFDEEVT
mgnify:CR=1 FL=1